MSAVKNRALALSLLAAGAVGGLASQARAGVVYPTSVTASSSYSGYAASDAIDRGSNYLVTDWAEQGGGVGGYLDMTFAAPSAFLSFNLTDRTTSGGPNGAYAGGTAEFTTKFSIQAYSSATFTATVGPSLLFTKPVPVSPSSPADFTFSGSLGTPLSPFTAQYIRYTILAIDGSTTNTTANAGLANIQFATVPEPWSLSILAFGVLILVFKRRPASAV